MNPRPKLSRGRAAIGGAIAAALAIATPFVAGWEGTETKPYWDRLGGVWTVCTGETNVEMREYTEEECQAMLESSLEGYAERVLALSPGIDESPYEWAAHTSLAYNVGVAAYSRSSIRRKFNQGDRIGACRAITLYNRAGGQVVRGLVFRREGDGQRIGEEELCMTGAILHEFPL